MEESWLSLRRINLKSRESLIFFFNVGNKKTLSSICRFLGAVNWFYFPIKRICITILWGWGLDASLREVHLRAPSPSPPPYKINTVTRMVLNVFLNKCLLITSSSFCNQISAQSYEDLKVFRKKKVCDNTKISKMKQFPDDLCFLIF